MHSIFFVISLKTLLLQTLSAYWDNQTFDSYGLCHEGKPSQASLVWNMGDVTLTQGFMQDTIIASHTCFGGHMDINC